MRLPTLEEARKNGAKSVPQPKTTFRIWTGSSTASALREAREAREALQKSSALSRKSKSA